MRLGEEDFWRLTPREFALLMKRHRGDVRWREVMAAVTPWILANVHRSIKKRRKPFALADWTVSGLTGKKRKKAGSDEGGGGGGGTPAPETVWAKISTVMRAFGGKRDGDSSSR